uniref:Putative secreted protein n=1 Tax=Panstrongylus lignarius TaxID=156445 RepID=A0A224Y5B8_9HEMI
MVATGLLASMCDPTVGCNLLLCCCWEASSRCCTSSFLLIPNVNRGNFIVNPFITIASSNKNIINKIGFVIHWNG